MHHISHLLMDQIFCSLLLNTWRHSNLYEERVSIYTDHKTLHHLRSERSKANVVADALSRKERVKPRRVRAISMTIQFGVKRMILAAQSEVFKQECHLGKVKCIWKERHVSLRGSVLDVFHASNLKKCLADANLHVPLEGIKADKHSSFCEELIEIIDREDRKRYAYLMLRDYWIGGVRLPILCWLWDRMGTPTQCDMMCDTFVVSIIKKVKLGRLASETVGLHVEFP
ncbi:hypothetical protein Tco_1379157 [Tanacetum coccineum]